MKKSLRLFSKQARSWTGTASNKLSLSLRLCSAITVFLVLSLYASTASGQNYNTVLGYKAYPGSSSHPSYQNTAIGYNALNANTTGGRNTANGASALASNKTGTNNTANGYNALYNNTTGANNTANGTYALVHNTTGDHNTANGYLALYYNTIGYSNSASGPYALHYNKTGSNNTANGMYALYNNTSGYFNSAIGHAALYSNTTGYFNNASGMLALYANKTGNGNTGLGYGTDVLIDSLSNATAIGSFTVVDASNKVRVGNTYVTSIGGQVGWTTFSDGRYKKDIQENVTGLAFINSLRPVTYTVDVAGLNRYFNKDSKQLQGIKEDSIHAPLPKAAEDPEDPEAARAAGEASKIVYDGFIAQEVEAAAKKLGIPFSGVDKPKSKDGLYGLRYDNFVPQLVKSVQELSKMNSEKEAKIDAQQKQNDAQQSQIEELQKQLDELKALVLAKGQTASSSSSSSVVLTDAALGQNAPNPFDKTTVIPYTLPQKFTVAQIVITDQNGRVLSQVNLSGTGKGTLNVDAGTLAAGAYTYSLVVDGRVIDAKRMVLAR